MSLVFLAAALVVAVGLVVVIFLPQVELRLQSRSSRPRPPSGPRPPRPPRPRTPLPAVAAPAVPVRGWRPAWPRSPRWGRSTARTASTALTAPVGSTARTASTASGRAAGTRPTSSPTGPRTPRTRDGTRPEPLLRPARADAIPAPRPPRVPGSRRLTERAVSPRRAPRSGRSSTAATSASTLEPSSPSTSRWSKRQRQRGDLARLDLALVHPRLELDRAEREDRGLAGVEDRRAGVDAEDADVGDRDRAARHVGRGASCPRGPWRPARRARRPARGSVLACASLMFGTISPRGVAAAMPRLT